MGLDAVVFCDCVEKKRLKVPHPYPRLLYISPNDSPEIRSKDAEEIERHDEWMELPPCEHEAMMLGGCVLGNMSLVERVRDALGEAPKPPLPRCSVLLGRVLYCGTHTRDHLTIAQVQRLAKELRQLKGLDLKRLCVSPQDQRLAMSIVTKQAN